MIRGDDGHAIALPKVHVEWSGISRSLLWSACQLSNTGRLAWQGGGGRTSAAGGSRARGEVKRECRRSQLWLKLEAGRSASLCLVGTPLSVRLVSSCGRFGCRWARLWWCNSAEDTTRFPCEEPFLLAMQTWVARGIQREDRRHDGAPDPALRRKNQRNEGLESANHRCTDR